MRCVIVAGLSAAQRPAVANDGRPFLLKVFLLPCRSGPHGVRRTVLGFAGTHAHGLPQASGTPHRRDRKHEPAQNRGATEKRSPRPPRDHQGQDPSLPRRTGDRLPPDLPVRADGHGRSRRAVAISPNGQVRRKSIACSSRKESILALVVSRGSGRMPLSCSAVLTWLMIAISSGRWA